MNDGLQALSEREKETLRLLLGGHDIKSIAAGLGLSVNTVNERLREARRKLGASSSRQAARMLADAEQGGHKFSGDFSGAPNSSGHKEIGVADEAARTASHERSHRAPAKGHSVAWLAGGMLVMSLIIAAAVLSFALQEGARTSAQSTAQTPAQITSAAPAASASAGSAREWLALVDGQNWEDSWSAAGELFRTHVTPADWASNIQPIRPGMGAVSSRVLKDVTKATKLPGLPDGQYEILQFATSFARKPDAIETVTLVREPSGWKVDGYFIK